MKVLHVIQAVAPRYGGPTTTIWPLLGALNHIPGMHAELATTDADGPGKRLHKLDINREIPLHIFPRNFSEQWKYSRRLGQWLSTHVHEFDVVHIHGIWTYPNMAAARAAERFGIPYIIRPAGMLSAYCLNSKSFKKRIYWTLIEGRTIRGAAGFHSTAEDETQDIRVVRPDARTFLIPQGMEANAFLSLPDPMRLRVKCGVSADDRPVVLFLGRLHPVKGIADLLLPAFAKLTCNAVLAIGGGPDFQAPGYEQAVKRTIVRLNLTDRVVMLGAVRPSDRWNLFDGASVFVLPSYSENFGMVVVEAMARGCPVVVTEGVGAKAQVRAAGAGKIVAANPDAIAAALTELLSNPVPAIALGSAGRAYARENLTWAGVANGVHEMYHNIIST